MIITCPHCRTKYQVTFEAIGSAGRKVQCAHCHRAWDQQPLPRTAETDADDAEADRLFDSMAEDALDEALMAEANAVALEQPKAVAPAPPEAAKSKLANAADLRKQQAAFSRRQNAMISRLPLARMRRAARVAGVIVLAGILSFGYFGRTAIVERYPDLAAVYAAVGLGVNVVGLDFTSLQTLKSLSNGNDMLTVSAQIVGISPEPVVVPPVVVSLLNEAGHAVYEWSVLPRVRDLMAGERATFDTRLSLPPSEAVRVRLSFAGANWIEAQGTATPAVETEPTAPAPEAAAPAETHTAPAAAATEHH